MGRWAAFSLFVLIFSLTYGALHLYLYRRIRSHTRFGPAFYRGLALFLGVMVVSPIACRMVVWEKFFVFGYLLTYISSLWLGFIFYFFLISLVSDLGNWAYGVLARRRNALLAGGWFLLMGITISLGICVYAYYEALGVQVREVSLETAKLPEGTEQLSIAQISDVHLGVIIGEERLRKITQLLKEIGPDIIVSTGDLLDQEIDRLDHLSGEIASLTPPLGKYAVLGNHEFYAGVKKSTEFMEKAGFRLLRGEKISVNGIINIAGIDDPAVRHFGEGEKKDVSAVLGLRNPDQFTLFLCHRPPNSEEHIAELPIDLQLSGHTHAGQLFPFGFVTRIFFPLKAGLYAVNGRRLYVSRGVGTWGPPLRFLTPPEIVVIRLKRSPFHQRSGP